MFVPVLFRHPDGCRWQWQARFNVYSSLFTLESSGSHPTLSHLKENNKSFLPVWNNRPAEGWVRWGIFAESIISARLSDIDSVFRFRFCFNTHPIRWIDILWVDHYISLITCPDLLCHYLSERNNSYFPFLAQGKHICVVALFTETEL